MIDSSRAGRIYPALLFLLFAAGLHAQSLTSICGGSISTINMISGHNATRSIACYSTYSGMKTFVSSTMNVYLPSEPQSGSSTLPASSIAVSTDGSAFTTFTGTGSSSPLTIYVRITVPGGQNAGQYTGTLMASTTVTYNP